MAPYTTSGQILPLLALGIQRFLDSAPVGGSCHGSSREQPGGEAGGLGPRAPGFPGVYSEEEAVSDIEEEAWAGGGLWLKWVSPLLSAREAPSCHRKQVGHNGDPWEGPWTQLQGRSPKAATSR